MGPEALAQVLQPLTTRTDPNLIVGLQTSDDAAVYLLNADLAIIQTVDFFPPVVDDPWAYGQVAAANSMSDVYAMGGEVRLALNVAAWPDGLDPALLTRIFEGGAAKVAEAGAVIAGGHTVTDREPKYGLSVTGTIDPGKVWTKGGAQVGDVLFLTKALGSGLVTTAHKNDAARQDDLAAAIASMATLNMRAARAARAVAVHACTDITGFGLLGHAHEVAERSGVRILVDADRLPVLPGAIDYAAAGHIPGGLGRNRDWYGSQGVTVAPEVDPGVASLLWDPETSGGLLFAIAATEVEALRERFAADGVTAWEIGRVVAGSGVHATRGGG